MATFANCPQCGNSIRIPFAELEESVIQIVCMECNDWVEIYLESEEES